MTNNSISYSKTFFSKNSALKVMFNKETKRIYCNIGKKNNDIWQWKKIKLNCVEAGKIIRVLAGKLENTSFIHKFNDVLTKIWVNKKEDTIFFRVEDISKSLNEGEQEVLKILLERMILEENRQ